MTSRNPVEILRRHGLKPKQSWGQNFLSDDYTLGEIAAAVALHAGEPVVELGPGLGHLTMHLLATGAQVTAVERDRDMVTVLEELRSALPPEESARLKIVAGNAATVDFAEVAGAPKVAVVGNLPYHLTSPILFRVLEQRPTVSRAVFTLQSEVVTRLAASPGGREYGILSVLLGLYFEIEHLHTLPAHLFHPPPRVDSAVVRLTALARPRAEIRSDERFRKVVKAGFAQRRKTLLNSLKSDKTLGSPAELLAALQGAGIDPQRRAETLSPQEFAALERALPPT
jgi:16S rRNA (adenine1518-N6/adenine1519-N6)-dimethyltransferase